MSSSNNPKGNPVFKYIICSVLFVLPILFYLFFATGNNTFSRLPVLTPNLPELPVWKSSNDSVLKLNNKITILGFPGKNLLKEKATAYNLVSKIYDKNKTFNDFQVIFVVPQGMEADVAQVVSELAPTTDMVHFNFAFAPEAEIQAYYKNLNLIGGLDENLGNSNVYIIDKERSLRGRKGMNNFGKEEYKEGYNTISAADLHNEMSDDVKVILAEYRLSLKKYNRKK